MKQANIFLRLLLAIFAILLVLFVVVLHYLIFVYAFDGFKSKERVINGSYYYIPEAELYVKTELSTLRLSRSLGSLKLENGCSTDFRIKNSSLSASIYYPLGGNTEHRIYVKDQNDCLGCLRGMESVVWISDKDTGFAYPESVEIVLPPTNNGLIYRLPGSADCLALPVEKETVEKEKTDARAHGCDLVPLEILPEHTQPSLLEDANIHVKGDGEISLYLRDNVIVCRRIEGGRYPDFYYSPQYPNYLFCSSPGDHIVSKKCEDIQLIMSPWTLSDIRQKGLKKWYAIHPDPFKIEEIN